MCLPNFERFEVIDESNPIIGYRKWRLSIENPIQLKSDYTDYNWTNVIEGPHEVTDKDSGIYSYNNYYNNYNNEYYNYYYYSNYGYHYYYNNRNYNNHNNFYYYYYNNYYNNYNSNCYNVAGIIHQWGKVAIHKAGYRSEYAKVITLFTIKEPDVQRPGEFLEWIKKFNTIIQKLANKYEANTIPWQDFLKEMK
jgi:hypothetical protein